MRPFDAAVCTFICGVCVIRIQWYKFESYRNNLGARFHSSEPEGVEKNSEDAQSNALKHIEDNLEMIINYCHSQATMDRSHSEAEKLQYVKDDSLMETKVSRETKGSRVMKKNKDAIHLLPEVSNAVQCRYK